MILRVRDLDLAYGQAQALDRVSLDVEEGSIVAIVGANGAGKSSLIRTIAGMEKPGGGTIEFRGRNIAGWESHAVCNLGVGQVAEGRQIFPTLSVEDNLAIGALLPRARRKARDSMQAMYAMFPRLAERRSQMAGTLSGGEQQMLAIARCLMAQPDLIMFDEPSLGLAPVVMQEVLQTILKLNAQGITILLVEQNVAVSLRISKAAYVLENGRIVMSGPGPELLRDERVRKAYLGL